MSTADLARSAARAAARLRGDLGIGPADGACPFDIAEQLGVLVRLVPLPSLEGVYSPGPRPTIVLSAERPPGRKRYTCGHELGHHVFGHGARIDEVAGDVTAPDRPEEFLAQRFAAALVMPKLAIDAALGRRGWRASQLTPERVFVVAQELGVGFTTLVGQLEWTLGYLRSVSADTLRRMRLRHLRERIAGFKVVHDLFVVDRHWGRQTIDLEVGDVVMVPDRADLDGTCASLVTDPIRHLRADTPGIGSVLIDLQRPPVRVRVSRRAFVGLARYRHLEEVGDDE